ncbi:MAG: hypothetical protein AUI14_02665 [Actinobacteria bacterium 13_2_20CM_2_71_6]|nr:MAG: hypothetical protein AUI14_02665 [Actinobacteria bacterium 13_2_20CM_2_71_6]
MTTADEAPEEEELPTFSEQLANQLGGVRGVVESGVPVIIFVITKLIMPLTPALIVSVGSAVAIAGWRLARRQSVRHAVNGLVGIGFGAFLAWKTGSAKAFYLPGILISLAYGVALLGSVLIRRPLVGWVWSVVVAKGSMEWRGDPRLVKLFSRLTILWAVTYLVKVGIQAIAFQRTSATDPGTLLGILRLALGYPPYLLLIAVTVWAVRRSAPEGAEAVHRPAHRA